MRVRVSIATDFSEDYKFPRIYNIRGNKPSEVTAELQYALPSAVFGSWFRLKIEFLDNIGLTIQPGALRRIGLELEPKLPTEETSSKLNKSKKQ